MKRKPFANAQLMRQATTGETGMMCLSKINDDCSAHSDNAVGNVILALRAVQLGLRYRVGAVGTGLQWLLCLCLVWLPERGYTNDLLML